MPDLFAEWDEKRARATQPAQQTTPVVVPVGADLARGNRYALAALEGEIANIQAVPIGSGRNDQLNKSAVKMGHYVAAGLIDERLVIQTLGAADGGLDFPATAKTIASGLEAGKATPAVLPAPSVTVGERAPWEDISEQEGEWSSDPFSDNYRSAPTSGSTSSSATRPDGAPSAGESKPSNRDSAQSPSATTSPQTPSSSNATVAPRPSASTVGHYSGTDHPAPASSSTKADTTSAPSSPDDPNIVLEAHRLRTRRAAARLVDHEDATALFRPPPFLLTLADELAIPDDPVTYAVEAVFPTGANVLLTAQYKTGKTTMVSNLARSFVDDEPFLGRYAVTPPAGRVAIFNYEVDRDQYRRWLRDVGFDRDDRVAILNLRGYRMPLNVPHVETWVVEWLKRAEASVWIVDPFARAATGVDENSNTEVGQWLDTLDVIKGRAGVTELVLPTHTGRGEHEIGEERARGATRLDDWADVRWMLTKDKHDVRYFRATGRDVEQPEGALTFDQATRLLTLSGGNRRSNAESRIDDAVRGILTARHDGPSLRDLVTAVKQMVPTGANLATVGAAVGRLEAVGEVKVEREKTGHRHYLTPSGRDPFTG